MIDTGFGNIQEPGKKKKGFLHIHLPLGKGSEQISQNPFELFDSFHQVMAWDIIISIHFSDTIYCI